MDVLISKIVGYEGFYEIDSLGNVYSVERYVNKWDGVRKLSRKKKTIEVSNCGYARVTLSKNNKNIKYSVHRLVADAFIENKEKKPFVNHKDGNKLNNSLENLEWVTRSENIIHAIKTLNRNIGKHQKKGEIWYKKNGAKNPAKKSILMFDKINNYSKEFESISEAAIFLGTHASIISAILKGKRNSKKYNFKYK